MARGVLLAVGRPDGRLCCLARSENSILLAVKQAAFIQNPAYPGRGAGPDIVTIGHNPYKPNLSLAECLNLKDCYRSKFVDEEIYERLYQAKIPFSKSIIGALAHEHLDREEALTSGKKFTAHHYGTHFAERVVNDPENAGGGNKGHLQELVMSTKDILQRAKLTGVHMRAVEMSNNPSVREAFCSKLDHMTQVVQDNQLILQTFYETRVASLERYIPGLTILIISLF